MLKYIEYITVAAIFVAATGLFVLMFVYGSPASVSDRAEPASATKEVRQASYDVEMTLWQKARTDPVAMFTFWLVLFTAVLSTVGVIQLKFLRRAEAISANSAQAARDSANVAKQSTQIAERALIVANRPWIKVDVQVGGPITYNVNGANFTFNFILKNIGRSPATNVWVNFKPVLLYPSDDPNAVSRNPRQMLRDEITDRKNRPPSPFGFAMFPDETIVQQITASVPQDEVDRATKLIKAIYPTVYGYVEYRIGLDTTLHHTGFMLELQRDPTPRPFTIQGNKSPAAIWIEEGTVPPGVIRILRSFIEGGYAD